MSMEPFTPRQLITVEAAAELKECHPQTVRRWIRLGLLPAYRYRVGARRVLVDVADLEALTRPLTPAGTK